MYPLFFTGGLASLLQVRTTEVPLMTLPAGLIDKVTLSGGSDGGMSEGWGSSSSSSHCWHNWSIVSSTELLKYAIKSVIATEAMTDLHITLRATGADRILCCSQTAQWYLPANSLLARKTAFITGFPSLNQTMFTGVAQPDMQVRLTRSPSATEFGSTTAVSSESQERG